MRTNRLLCTFLSLLALAGSMGAASESTRKTRPFWGSGMSTRTIGYLYPTPTREQLRALEKDSPYLGDEEINTLMAISNETIGDFVKNNTLENILRSESLRGKLTNIMQRLSLPDRYTVRNALLEQHKKDHEHALSISREHLNSLQNPKNRALLEDATYLNRVKEEQDGILYHERQYNTARDDFSAELDTIIKTA